MLVKGDARRIPLAAESVQCVVTSPPYWQLRDYGVVGQRGLESTPEEYVENMVAVFREVWRVLKVDGTLWLNLGDSYAASGRGGGGSYMKQRREAAWKFRYDKTGFRAPPQGYKQKDLVGVPWMVAFALRSDGWYLRSDIIWAKPNPMPESVQDRPTKAHEYLFLLSKQPTYYYDADAIKEAAVYPGDTRHLRTDTRKNIEPLCIDNGSRARTGNPTGEFRNRRTVWAVATQPTPYAHFATFPEKLIEPCILAGSRQGDIVFDPFVGSGTTIRVAETHHRKGVGLDLAYQDVATKRLESIQPVLLDLGQELA
jgi:DNA modification methylase